MPPKGVGGYNGAHGSGFAKPPEPVYRPTPEKGNIPQAGGNWFHQHGKIDNNPEQIEGGAAPPPSGARIRYHKKDSPEKDKVKPKKKKPKATKLNGEMDSEISDYSS